MTRFFSYSLSLELLDKHEAPSVPDGYGLSVGFVSLLDVVKCVSGIVTSEIDAEERRIRNMNKDKKADSTASSKSKRDNGILTDVDPGNTV